MRTEHVEYYSEGDLVRALWRTPDQANGPAPAIIQGPGWLGLKDAKVYDRYHAALTEAGYGVLSIDYRGFGDSEGERGVISPTKQLEDLLNGVTYLTTRADVNGEAIGAFATGGTGGGNVVMVGALDDRVRTVVSQFPVADGEDWLHRMRAEHEWISYQKELEEDRKERVLTGRSRLVHPREEIMVQTPERRRSGFKNDVDEKISTQVPLSTVDALLRYRPIDAARGMTTPLMLIAVEGDATTPEDHARAIYDVAAGPKRFLLQRHTSHYAAYDDYTDLVLPEIIGWLRQHLRGRGAIEVHGDPGIPTPELIDRKATS